MTTALLREKLVFFSSGPLRQALTTARRLARPVWRLLTFSLGDEAVLPKRALAVSIEPSGLHLVCGARVLSRITLGRTRFYPFEEGKYPSPGHLASAVALARLELKAHRAEVTLSIPKAWALARIVTLPAAVKENLANVMAYELDRLTPFSAEVALYDFQPLGETDGKLRVSLVAARADLVTPYLEALKEKGIVVTRVSVAHAGLATLANTVAHEACFVHLTAKSFDAGLCTDGTLGAVYSGPAEQVCDVLLREAGTRRILCTGEPAALSALKERLPSVADLNEALPRKWRAATSPFATGSVVEALLPRARGFNLLHRGHKERVRVPVMLSVVLALTLFAIGALYVVTPLKLEEQRLAAIDGRVRALKGEVKKVEGIKKEVEGAEAELATIENLKQGKPMALTLLKELTTLLPKNAWLTRVRLTETTVEIDGYAAAATELLPKLEASPLLKKVEFASPTFRDVRLNADRFVIKMEIEGVTRGK